MLGHQLRTTPQEDPRQEGADDGITDTDPGGGESVLPTKLSCVAHEDHGREIRGAKGKGREPGTYGTSAQYESINTAGLHGQEN